MTTSPDSSENKSNNGEDHSIEGSEQKVVGLSSRAKKITSSFIAAVIVLSTFGSLFRNRRKYPKSLLVDGSE